MPAGDMNAGPGAGVLRRLIGQPVVRSAGGWLRLALGLALLAFSLREIDWGRLSAHVASVQPGWLAAALFSVLAGTALKILRWDVLLGGCGLSARPRLARLGGAYLVGQAANILLPFRGGEVVRIGWLAVEERQDTRCWLARCRGAGEIPRSGGAAPADLWLGPTLPIEAHRTQPFLAGAALRRPLHPVGSRTVAGSAIVGAMHGGWNSRLAGRWSGWLARMDGWVTDVQMLRSARVVLPVIALSGLIWA